MTAPLESAGERTSEESEANPAAIGGGAMVAVVTSSGVETVPATRRSSARTVGAIIRAIPEGGSSGSASTNFRRTFYSRLQNGGTSDRRQPLPSIFAGRWFRDGVGTFTSSVKIWREGRTGATAGCAVSSNAARQLPDIVRFDEDENSTELTYYCNFGCPDAFWNVALVHRLHLDDTGVIPPNPGRDPAGWMYFNLHDYRNSPSDQIPGEIATQGWIIWSIAAEGRYSVDLDAAALGNGCSSRTPFTAEDEGPPAIGPAPNANPSATPNP